LDTISSSDGTISLNSKKIQGIVWHGSRSSRVVGLDLTRNEDDLVDTLLKNAMHFLLH
jgi:hypothetical protein